MELQIGIWFLIIVMEFYFFGMQRVALELSRSTNFNFNMLPSKNSRLILIIRREFVGFKPIQMF